jgi:hypothetical protein
VVAILPALGTQEFIRSLRRRLSLWNRPAPHHSFLLRSLEVPPAAGT